MPTLRINSVQARTIISTTTSTMNVAGQLGTTGGFGTGQPAPSAIFGQPSSGLAMSQIFVFKGTPPSDFSAFTSISSRLSDLLVAIPIGSLTSITSTNTVRFLAAASSGTSRTLTINNSAGSLARSSNVVTVTVPQLPSATNIAVTHGICPGQSFTISGVTLDTSFNGTFTVQSVPSATTFTFNQTGSNSSINGTAGTITVPFQAISSGTAAWFCICRTNGSWTPSAAFTDFGAMLGTVGAAGSGADLEIASTNITAGANYTSAGMYINIPLNWTF